MHSHTINLGKFKKELTLTGVIQKTKFSEVYECKYHDKEAILKIKKNKLFENDISQENVFASQLVEKDLAPKILAYDHKNNLTIYVKHIGTSAPADPDKIFLEKCAQKLSCLHNLPIDSVNCDPFLLKVKKYEEAIGSKSLDGLCKKALDFIYSSTEETDSLALCHNDLNVTNILYFDDVVFIDWDYAAINHPYYDLATLFNALKLTRKDQDYFSSIYKHANGNIDYDLLDLYKKMPLCVEYLWIIAAKVEYHSIFKARYNELKRQLLSF